jgi:ABC-2 type transport system permease protein
MDEFKAILRDPGVMVLFLLAPIAYPILYSMIYKNEVVHNVPIAVVDMSGSEWSRKYIRNIDATSDVAVTHRCISMEEADELYKHRKVHGILLIPSKFQHDIYNNKQTTVVAYIDMSSFLYYRALVSATSYVSNALGIEIQVGRLMAQDGMTYRQAITTAAPFTYSSKILYNPKSGYASFLLPAVLIIIIYQTLILGIGMRTGTEYERAPLIDLNRINRHRQSIFGLLAGKSLCYLLLYGILIFHVVELVPHWFKLPQMGDMSTVLLFMLPFLLSTIFFALAIATFLHKRENAMVLFLFSSVPLLFLSGVLWPIDAVPGFWKLIGWFLPSTHGIQGYVKINTMGAPLELVWKEYLNLWLLTGIYFIVAYIARIMQLHRLQAQLNLAD